VDAEEGMVAPGMMVSLDMVAIRPRCEVEVIRLARADWSSWEADRVVSKCICRA
jgi:hypothetical protein